MRPATASAAAHDVHTDVERATLVHVTHELGLDPEEQASPRIAAISSFVCFSIGAFIPLIPYILGFASLAAGLAVGAVGLLLAGGVASLATSVPWWQGSLRQLGFGAVAAGATYVVGLLIGVNVV
jgi:VIT1/CCC1 family predicted Fe2+/Mn2+ transporter